MIFKLKLNTNVEDTVSGFSGVILGRTEYATGCIQYGVSPTDLDKEGKLKDWEWFDEMRLKVIKKKKIASLKDKGGPAPRAPSVN